MVVTDCRDLSVVAGATLNETNLVHFARFLADFLIRYPKTILVPENKSSGQMIIDSLLVILPRHGYDPFKKIYNRIVDESGERKEEYKAIAGDFQRRPNHLYDKYKKLFGFNTTGDSREKLYSTVLQNAAKQSGDMVHDKVLSQEIRGLIVKNGRIDHSASGHDDMVIAWLLTEWFLTHSKNLSHYGLDSTKVLSSYYTHAQKNLSPVEEHDWQEQQKKKEEMEEVYEQLRKAKDAVTIARLEHRLRVLDSQIENQDDDSMTIDNLIETAKQNRARDVRSSGVQKSRLNPSSIWGQ